ncbi:MAG: hypothetical protein WKG07_00990 [Hymenobacter sp.]
MADSQPPRRRPRPPPQPAGDQRADVQPRCLALPGPHPPASSPDVVLAVETDDWWLEPAAAASNKTHPYTCHAPLPNTYGMLVFLAPAAR